MTINQFSHLERCATCGKPADPAKYHKKIIRSDMYFCTEACLDMCCCIFRIQIGVAFAIMIALLSYWIGLFILPLALIGLWPFLTGLRGVKQCIFDCPSKCNDKSEIDPDLFGKI